MKGRDIMATWHRRNNCYSYAINNPKKWMLINQEDYSNAVWTLLRANPNWKLVSKEDVVLGKEYVAFRYCATDFHFMKRNKQGYWRHKMGGSPVTAISTKEVFAKTWALYHNYNSKLYLFEICNT